MTGRQFTGRAMFLLPYESWFIPNYQANEPGQKVVLSNRCP